MVELCRVTSIFSLWASNSVPMPAVGERNVRAGTTDVASGAKGASSFRWEKGVGMSIAFWSVVMSVGNQRRKYECSWLVKVHNGSLRAP